MATHASHAALPFPIRNARFTLGVPYLDADGDPTDPTTPDTEFSLDAGAYGDCAEEVTTISGSNGSGLITLTGAETNGSLLFVTAKVASGPKATIATLYPRNLPIVSSGTLSAGSAGGGTLGTILAFDVTGCFIRTTGGTGGGGTGGANNQARRIVTYVVATGAFTVGTNWETTPDATTTYDVLLPEGMTLGSLKALNPTTAGRTLDVSSGGEAGLDWANIGSPTTTVNLSGTSTKAVEPGTGTNQITLTSGQVQLQAIHRPFGHSGTLVSSASTTTAVLAATASSVDNYYTGQQFWIYSGAGAHQTRVITGYVGATQTITVDRPWIGQPDNTSLYAVSVVAAAKLDTALQVTAGALGTDAVNAAALATTAVDEIAAAILVTPGNKLATATGGSPILRTSESRMIRSSTAQAGGATSITLDAGADANNDFYKGCLIFIHSGTGALQGGRVITAYNGTTKVATVNRAWVTNPDVTSLFAIHATEQASLDTNLAVAVASFTAGAITAAAFAAGAIDASAIAANAIGSSEIAAGAITAAKFAAGAIDATAIADGAIDAATFAAGAINAAAIAADAIGASELAADAVAEIADQVWDELIAGHAVAGSTGEKLNAASAAGDPWGTALPGAYAAGSAGNIVGNQIPAIKAKTDNLPASPAAVGSAMTLSANAVDAAALATDAVTEIVSAIKAAALSELTQATPAAAPTLEQAIMLLYHHLRDQTTTASGVGGLKIRNDAGTVIAKGDIQDDGTTFTKGKLTSGP